MFFNKTKNIMQKRKYRINPICPNCGEEHCCWTITFSDEEQETLDNYYKTHEESSQKKSSSFQSYV